LAQFYWPNDDNTMQMALSANLTGRKVLGKNGQETGFQAYGFRFNVSERDPWNKVKNCGKNYMYFEMNPDDELAYVNIVQEVIEEYEREMFQNFSWWGEIKEKQAVNHKKWQNMQAWTKPPPPLGVLPKMPQIPFEIPIYKKPSPAPTPAPVPPKCIHGPDLKQIEERFGIEVVRCSATMSAASGKYTSTATYHSRRLSKEQKMPTKPTMPSTRSRRRFEGSIR